MMLKRHVLGVYWGKPNFEKKNSFGLFSASPSRETYFKASRMEFPNGSLQDGKAPRMTNIRPISKNAKISAGGIFAPLNIMVFGKARSRSLWD